MPTNNTSVKLIGTPDEGLLLYLIADLMRYSSLQARFLANPEEVMDWYRLTDQARAVLFTMKADIIGGFLNTEFQVNGQLVGPVPDWPGPHPHLDAISPGTAASGSSVTVTVKGEGLLDGATVKLIPPGGGAPITAIGQIVRDPASGGQSSFRDVTLAATFDLTRAAAGAYDVRVRNSVDVGVEIGFDVGNNHKKFTVT